MFVYLYTTKMKYLLITLGTISLVIGMIGLITPGLPTTPFVLLTGVLFAKGSPRLHEKLRNHKITSKYLNRVDNGVDIKTRIISIAFMWCMISVTAFFVFEYGTMRFVMIGLGIVGTISQLLFFKTKRKKQDKDIIPSTRINKKQN